MTTGTKHYIKYAYAGRKSFNWDADAGVAVTM